MNLHYLMIKTRRGAIGVAPASKPAKTNSPNQNKPVVWRKPKLPVAMSYLLQNPSAIFLLLISPAVGSFLNVLIDRLPRGEDVVSRASACRSCGHKLRLAELVPLLSYALARGKCRACSVAIPPYHPLVELAAIAAAALAIIAGQTPVQMALGAAYLWILLTLAVTDWQVQRLPDALSASLLLIALALATVTPGHSLVGAALSGGIASLLFYLLRLAYRHLRHREGMGMGDVKLMAGIAAGLGLELLPYHLLLSSSAGLGVALVASIKIKQMPGQLMAVPFGTYLCAACALLWFLTRV